MTLAFDPLNLFPAVDLANVSYADLKSHAKAVDEQLGFEIDAIEARLMLDTPRQAHALQWIGLLPSTLQTPYLEIRYMLEKVSPSPGASFVDLGAGYGRMAFVLHELFPSCKFTGIESALPRVEEANRIFQKHGLKNAVLVCADLLHDRFELPRADVYFLYDLGPVESIKQMIDKLRMLARTQKVTVIGRGRGTRDQIEKKEPWLSEIVAPEHFGNFTIYRSG